MLSPNFVKLAEAHGLPGYRVERRDQVAPVVEQARSSLWADALPPDGWIRRPKASILNALQGACALRGNQSGFFATKATKNTKRWVGLNHGRHSRHAL